MVSYGYDGPIAADTWAKMQTGLALDYSAAGTTDCKVTGNAGGAQVAAGTISGWGVMDVLASPTQVALSAPSSGQSWWLICARRTWGATKATSFVAISAGTARPALLPTRQVNPGAIDDQPLALVGWTAGQSLPTQIVDLRAVGMAGQQVAFDGQALLYLTRLGRQVLIGKTLWVCVMGTSALEWRRASQEPRSAGAQWALSVTSDVSQAASFVAAAQVLPAVPYVSEVTAFGNLGGVVSSGGEWQVQLGYNLTDPGVSLSFTAVMSSCYLNSASTVVHASSTPAGWFEVPANTQAWVRLVAARISGTFRPQDALGPTLSWTRKEI